MKIKDIKKDTVQEWGVRTAVGDPVRVKGEEPHYIRTDLPLGQRGAVVCLETGGAYLVANPDGWEYDDRTYVVNAKE